MTDEEEDEHESDHDDMPELESCSEGSLEDRVKGDTFITKRALSTQLKEDCSEEQRETLFYTRCHVHGKVCSVIIDNGSYTNVVSILLINRLGLSTRLHPRPYKLP